MSFRPLGGLGTFGWAAPADTVGSAPYTAFPSVQVPERSIASMVYLPPPFPRGRPPCFRATVHGTVFAGRDRHLAAVHDGDAVRLVADPPGQDDPEVWVHLASGEPLGHLPPEIGAWLWPWMRGGGRAEAVAVHVGGGDEPSWRRLVVEVVCALEGGAEGEAGGRSAL